MSEKLDLDELMWRMTGAHGIGKDSIDMPISEIGALIARIRELESASQPGGGEAVSGAEWLALANQAHALKSSRETENESRYRFLRARFTKDCNVSTCSATDARHLALLGRIPILLLQHGTAAQPSEINRERGI